VIDFYTWSSPNSLKVLIMLEETGLEYRLRPVDLGRGEQRSAEFLAISPNGKVPAIVDHEGPDGHAVNLFESGAILLYLADKTGRFLPSEPTRRWQAVQWLMLQMAGVGPTFGQAGYFLHRAAEPQPAAVEHFVGEAERLMVVIERRLAGAEFFAGEYTIADMAYFPWLRNHRRFQIDLADFPATARWLDAVAVRPAVQRALELG
jgi:GST-like protein